MKGSLLILDGWNSLVPAYGKEDESVIMSQVLDRKVEITDSIVYAKSALEESMNRPFVALITDPFMIYDKDNTLVHEYQEFLKDLKLNKNLLIIARSSCDYTFLEKKLGIQKEIHYDAYFSKTAGMSSPVEIFRDRLDELLPSEII